MQIDTFYMDQAVVRDDEIDYIIEKLGKTPEIITDSRVVYEQINAEDDPVSAAKKILYITRNHGAVIKECPGTSYYTCCDYTILHTGTFCTMDCSYCILQAYFHPPVMQYFSGLNHLSTHLDPVFAQNKIFRIGTGEFTDSLIWEPVTLQPAFLVRHFAQQKNCILELKTKTTNIDSLLDIDHNQKTILAWSLNTPSVIQSEERRTRSLAQRLAAARKAQHAGYKIAFHFDPLVIYDGCEEEYKSVITLMFEHVRPENICWISIGSFRFMPSLKQIVEKRFPESIICYGEFITGLDNKMRYFKPLRIELYKALISHIRMFSTDVLVYFCMEDKQVWEQSMGFFPSKKGELGAMLDKSAVMHCNLDRALL